MERRDGSAWWRTWWGRIGSTRAGFLPQQMAFLLNNILMFGINTSLGHIFTKLYPKEITCTSSTVSTSCPAKGYLGIFCTSLGWVDIATDITWSFMVIPWILHDSFHTGSEHRLYGHLLHVLHGLLMYVDISVDCLLLHKQV